MFVAASCNSSDSTTDPKTAGAPTLEITSPKDGATINGGESSTIIKGKILGNSTSGVITQLYVDGELIAINLVQIQGNDFAGVVNLKEGKKNVISIIVTDFNDVKTETKLTLHQGVMEKLRGYIRFGVSPSMAVLSESTGAVDVSLEIDPHIGKRLISSYSLDFDGDGVFDKEGVPSERYSFETKATYNRPGLYYPTVTVTDENGDVFVRTIVVNILSVNQVNAIFQKSIDSLQDSLISGNIDKAVSLFDIYSQDKYRKMFESFSQTDRNDLAQEFGDVRYVNLFGGRAEYEIFTKREDGVTYSFPIFFVQTASGWKIEKF